MHEVSLVRGIFSNLKQNFSHDDLTKLVGVKLHLGKLSDAEPTLMMSAFKAIKEESGELPKAELNIEVTPVVIECEICGNQTEVENYNLVCSTCDRPTSNVVSGLEMEICELEFLEA